MDEEEEIIPAAEAGFPDIVQRVANPVRRSRGQSALVPSAASDAEPDGMAIEQIAPLPATANPAATTRRSGPSFPELADISDTRNRGKNIAALQRYGDKADASDAREAAAVEQQARKEANVQRETAFRARGIKHFTDANGSIVPDRDENGALRFTENTGPIEYDETGHAIQKKRDETGAVTVKQLDADAKIGTHAERPNELYRQNKNSAWDYLGTLDEGLKSDDPTVKSAAENAHLKLAQELHKTGAEVHGQAVNEATQKLRLGLADVQQKSAQIGTLTQELSTIDADPRLTEKQPGGGIFGSQIGAGPSEGATALQKRRADLDGQVSALREQGYTGDVALDTKERLADVKAAVTAANEEKRTWDGASPKRGVDLEDALTQRRAVLAANGADPESDPVIAAIEERKQAMGIMPPSAPTSSPVQKTEAVSPLLAAREQATGGFGEDAARLLDPDRMALPPAMAVKASQPVPLTPEQQAHAQSGAEKMQRGEALTGEEFRSLYAGTPAADRKKLSEISMQQAQVRYDEKTAVKRGLAGEVGTALARGVLQIPQFLFEIMGNVENVARQGVAKLGLEEAEGTGLFTQVADAYQFMQEEMPLPGGGTADLRKSQNIKGVFEGGLKDTHWWASTLAEFLPSMLPSIGLMSAAQKFNIGSKEVKAARAVMTATEAGKVNIAKETVEAAAKTLRTFNTRLAFGSEFGMEYGSILGDMRQRATEEGRDNLSTTEQILSLGAGALAGAVGGYGDERFFNILRKRLGGAPDKVVDAATTGMMGAARRLAARVPEWGREAIKGTALEEAQEIIQTSLEQLPKLPTWTAQDTASLKEELATVAVTMPFVAGGPTVISHVMGKALSAGQTQRDAAQLEQRRQAVNSEIDGLQPSELVAPEAVAPTQTALRGMVKIANGEPIESLTAAERAAVTEKHEADGLPRVEKVGSGYVITDAALERVRSIAPGVAQVLPASEAEQRQAILQPPAAATVPAASSLSEQPNTVSPAESSQDNVPRGETEQPTFNVHVENAAGETRVVPVQAATAEAAQKQVAAQIPAGQGLIREVEEITPAAPTSNAHRSTSNVEVGITDLRSEDLRESAIRQVAAESGRPATAQETARIGEVVDLVMPAVERWKGVFSAVKVTAKTQGSMGAATGIQNLDLKLSLSDIALHKREFSDPEGANLVIRHEAIHAVALQLSRDGRINPQATYAKMPAAVKAHVAGVYNPGKAQRDEFEDAHEFFRLMVEGELAVRDGKVLSADGKVITEQLSPRFIARIRADLVKLFEVFRDLAAGLRKQGASEETIAEATATRDLIVQRIKEIDGGAAAASQKGAPNGPTIISAARPDQPGGGSVGQILGVQAEPVGAERTAAGAVRAHGSAGGTGETGSGSAATAPAAGSTTGEELNDERLERSQFSGDGRDDAGAAAAVDSRGGSGSLRQGSAQATRPTDQSVQSLERGGITRERIGNASRISQNGRTVEVAFVAQDAIQARPSHDSQGRVTPGYDQAKQPRDRSQPAYRKQQQNIKRNLNFAQAAFFPETETPATTADFGSSTMDLDGDTVIGNGREIAIIDAYRDNTVESRRYKADFVKHASKFGIDPAAVMGMAQPILKRVIVSELSKTDLVRFSQESNSGAAMASNALETAAQDASRITPGLLSLFDPNYALDSQRNTDFVRAYTRDVIRSEGANEANLTRSDLTRRIRTAIFAHAYGMDETGRAAIERLAGDETDAGGKTITGGLLTVAPLVARLRSDIATGDVQPLDVSAALGRAAQDISEALRNKPAKQSAGDALENLRDQLSTDFADSTDLGKSVRDFLIEHRTNRANVEQGISNFVEGVYRLGNPKQPDLLGERAVPDALTIWRNATTPAALDRSGERALAAQALNEHALLSQPTDPRITEAFGADHPLDALGLPELTKTLPDDSPLLTPTVKLRTATVTADSKVARLGLLPVGEHSRPALRSAIARYFLRGGTEDGPGAEVPQPLANPEMLMMGGGGGAGKTSSLREIGGAPLGSVLVNADEVRTFLPEYDQIRATGDGRGAPVTHEEASEISDRVLALAQRRKVNVVLDGTMKTAANSLGQMRAAKAAGYSVKLLAVTIDPYEAAVRAALRAKGNLRFVPTNILLGAHKGFNASLPEYIRELGAENVNIFDNSGARAVEIPVADLLSGAYGEVDARGKINAQARSRQEIDARSGGEQTTEFEAGRDAGERAPAGSREGRAGSGALFAQDTATLDLFADYAATLPAAAKASRPAFKRQVKQDVPALAQSDAALGELFAIASNPQSAVRSPQSRDVREPIQQGTPAAGVSTGEDASGTPASNQESSGGTRAAAADAGAAVEPVTSQDQLGQATNETTGEQNEDRRISETSTEDQTTTTDTGRIRASAQPPASDGGNAGEDGAQQREVYAGDATGRVGEILADQRATSVGWNEHVDDPSGDPAWLDIATGEMHFNHNGLAEQYDLIRQIDGPEAADASVKVAVAEEQIHQRDRAATILSGHRFGELQERVWREAPEEIKNRVAATYGDDHASVIENGAEVLRMLYQIAEHGGRITETLMPWSRVGAAGTEAALRSWEVPGWIAGHLLRMQRVDVSKALGRAEPVSEDSPDRLRAARNLDPESNPELPLTPEATARQAIQAEADAEKTAAARFNEALPLAMKIAGSYGNVPGVEIADVQQHARMALVKAARAYDGSRGVPFPGLARASVNNALRDLYRGQMRRAGLEDTTLDADVTSDEGQVTSPKDRIAAPDDVRGDVVTAEGRRMLSDSIAELPARMQQAIEGILSGATLEEIGAELGGISRQAVGRLATEAMRRLRGKLGEKGVSRVSDLLSQKTDESSTDFTDSHRLETSENLRKWLGESVDKLSSEIDTALKAQATDDPIAQLMALLDADTIGEFQDRAAAETSGSRTIGRPDLSLGAEGPAIMGVDEARKVTATAETEEQWQREGEAMLAADYEGTAQRLAARALAGGTLSPGETKAAQLIVANEMSKPLDGAARGRVQALLWAYRQTGTEAARALGSRRDPFKTPEERNREFLAKAIFTPPAAVRKQMEGAGSPEERQRLLTADQERIARIEAELSKMGVSFDDILSGGFVLHGKGKELIRQGVEAYDVREQQALKLAQTGTRTAAEIAKMSGLGAERVKEINDKFIADMREKLRAKVAGGLTLENVDLAGALLSQSGNQETRNLLAQKTAAEVEAELDRIIKGMGFVPSAELGQYKVARRKTPKAKLFRPPSVPTTDLRLPNSDPVPFEERRQNQLAFKPGDEMRNVNPKPGDQITEPTGRVLGQPGLPLYQEYMVRKGADVGKVDDVVRIARIMQAANGNAVDMAHEYWINGLLSALGTHSVNIIGNSLNAGWDLTVQRGMEALLNIAYQNTEAATFGEFKYLARGLLPGVQRGIRLAVRAWKVEADFFRNDVLNEQVELFQEFEKGGGHAPAISGELGRKIRIPGRALLFMDSLYKGIIGQMEAGAIGYRIAKREGLSGEKLTARINTLVSTPNSEAWQRAAEKATHLTFQDESAVGEVSGYLKGLAQRPEVSLQVIGRLFQFFFPFTRTPWNIFKTGLQKTPYGAIPVLAKFAQAGFYKLKDGKPVFESYSQARQVRDLAEQTIAWITLAAIWGAVEGDDDDDDKWFLITGSSPRSETKKGDRELQQRAFGGNYQARFFGRDGLYINYSRWEPASVVLGTMTDTVKTAKKMKHGQPLAETMDGIWGYFLAQAESKPFLQGFGNISDLVRGKVSPTDYAKKTLIESLVPNLLRQPLRSTDEWVRDAKSAPAGYLAAPAGALAEPKIDLYGNPIAKGGTMLSRLLFPAGTKAPAQMEKADKLLLNWTRQNPEAEGDTATPSAITTRAYTNARGEKAEMTGTEFRKFSELAGRFTMRNLAGKISQRQIDHPTEADVKLIKKAVQDARDEAKTRMFPKPAAPARKTTSIADRLLQAA